MWGGVTVSLALKLRFDASMDDVDFTNLVKHLSDDRGQGLQGSINHMRHKSYDQHDFLLPFFPNHRRQSCNHMKRARLESYDDAIGCNHMKRARLES